MRLHLLVLLLCALYGSIFSIGKLALLYSPPIFLTGARMLLAGFILLVYQYFTNRKELIFQKHHFWPMFIIGLTGVYLTNILEFWGLQFLEAGKACFIYSFSPIATALLSYFCFHEKITFKKWIGLTVGILGFIPILVAHSSTEDSTGYFLFLSLAEAALLGAAIATSIGWTVMRVSVKNLNYSAVMSNATSMIIGGIFSIAHSLYSENWDPTPITELGPFMGWFLLLTLVSNLISYNLHAYLLKVYTATYISFTGLSTPFFAALFGWFFLDEIMSVYFWASFLCVSLGLYIYYKEELTLGHSPQKTSSGLRS